MRNNIEFREDFFTIPLPIDLPITPTTNMQDLEKSLMDCQSEGYKADQPDKQEEEQYKTFTCFEQLPLELQWRVWSLVARQPRIVGLRFQMDMQANTMISHMLGQTFVFHYSTGVAPPAILHVSTTSRKIGLEHYGLAFGSHTDIQVRSAPNSQWEATAYPVQIHEPPQIYVNWAVDTICAPRADRFACASANDHGYYVVRDNLSHICFNHFIDWCVMHGAQSLAWQMDGDMTLLQVDSWFAYPFKTELYWDMKWLPALASRVESADEIMVFDADSQKLWELYNRGFNIELHNHRLLMLGRAVKHQSHEDNDTDPDACSTHQYSAKYVCLDTTPSGPLAVVTLPYDHWAGFDAPWTYTWWDKISLKEASLTKGGEVIRPYAYDTLEGYAAYGIAARV